MSAEQNKIPVITVVRVKPKEGFEKQTLDWFHSIAESASHFKGLLSSEVFETNRQIPQKEIINIFRFDDYENLMLWENSEERKNYIETGKIYFEQTKEKQQFTGLEFWFEKKDSELDHPLVKWKMMALTTATIFILLNSLIPLCSKLFLAVNLPDLLRSLLNVIILVCLMTYFIMPFLIKMFSGWLTQKK